MKKMCVYSIVDNIAQNIVQNFLAVSDEMATRIFYSGFEKNKDLDIGDYSLYRSVCSYEYPETYAEILSPNNFNSVKLKTEVKKDA